MHSQHLHNQQNLPRQGEFVVERQEEAKIKPNFASSKQKSDDGGDLIDFLEYIKHAKETESIIMGQNEGKCCPLCRGKNKCNDALVLMRKAIRNILNEVNELKESYISMRDEVQLYFNNFYFILELVGENISEQATKRINILMHKKNTIIQDQRHKLQFLSHKNAFFEAKLKSHFQSKEKNKNQISQLERIQVPNKQTRDGILRQKQSQNAMALAPTEGSQKFQLSTEQQTRLSSLQLGLINEKNSEKYEANPIILSRIKSLKNLREKITKLKNELKEKKT